MNGVGPCLEMGKREKKEKEMGGRKFIVCNILLNYPSLFPYQHEVGVNFKNSTENLC